MFIRTQAPRIRATFFQGKVIIITGPRQVGKTTLVTHLLDECKDTYTSLILSGEHIQTKELLGSQDLPRLTMAFDDWDIICIDEGQMIVNIGTTLKILVDHYKDTKQIIVNGSSSLNLLSHVNESLAGRKRVFHLHPISFAEVKTKIGFLAFDQSLEQHLITGMYPRVLLATSLTEQISELQDLTSSVLYRDILEFQSIKNPAILTKLLKLLALQIGQEVSLSSLGQSLAMDGRTIERYIDLLEKSYIIYRLPPFYSNKKKEIIKMNKIYFYDLGIRNALLENFAPFSGRTDSGHIWENWIINERMKYMDATQIPGSLHFWRGGNQQEIDLIQDGDGQTQAYEIKWQKQTPQCPSLFRELYGDVPYTEIHRNNYFSYLS